MGAVISPCYIWDIVAAHALIKRAGLEFNYFDGSEIDYSQMYDITMCKDFIISGYKNSCKIIRNDFKKKENI
jgi:myo-inositol-1(or 4)-monophosphatase